MSSRAPSSVAEQSTFNRQVDGSNPSERASRDKRFADKCDNPRYARQAAISWRGKGLAMLEDNRSKRMAGRIDGLCDAYAAVATMGKRQALVHIEAEIERWKVRFAKSGKK